jgi:hypothetical protein
MSLMLQAMTVSPDQLGRAAFTFQYSTDLDAVTLARRTGQAVLLARASVSQWWSRAQRAVRESVPTTEGITFSLLHAWSAVNVPRAIWSWIASAWLFTPAPAPANVKRRAKQAKLQLQRRLMQARKPHLICHLSPTFCVALALYPGSLHSLSHTPPNDRLRSAVPCLLAKSKPDGSVHDYAPNLAGAIRISTLITGHASHPSPVPAACFLSYTAASKSSFVGSHSLDWP